MLASLVGLFLKTAWRRDASLMLLRKVRAYVCVLAVVFCLIVFLEEERRVIGNKCRRFRK